MLARYYKNQQFSPNLLSLIINPFYIIRKALKKSIEKKAVIISGKLLDFGCGSKPYKFLFSNVNEYVGLDIENDGHKHINEDIDVFYDGKTIPFENDYFDSVFSTEVFEHIFDLEETLNEIARVTKPGGFLLATIPFVWNEHEVPNDFGRYSTFGVIHLLKKHNYEIISIERTGHFASVLSQLIHLYIYETLATKNKYINIVLTCLISPLMVIHLFLLAILPKNRSLYFGSVVLARTSKRKL